MERTNYMKSLMTTTYPDVAVEAIKGGFKGAWERLIASRLHTDVLKDKSEAVLLVESVGMDYMKAAHLITESKIPSPCE